MQQSQPNVNFDQTSPVTCDSCGGIYFDQALHIRKISGLLTGTGQTSYMPIPVFSCKDCGHINSEFLPKEMQSLDDTDQQTSI